MHSVFLFAVSLWDIVESRAQGTEILPGNHMGDPLVLINVSRRWSQFITSSPQLWSYVLIDTNDEDVMEYLQLFFLLSRNRRLFIVLHGSGDVCDGIVMDMLQVGDRIETLVYPPNVSRSTLAKFRFYLGASHDQLEHVCRWHQLEVQSRKQYMGPYSFPISVQSLWMDGLFPLSRLMTLSHFQFLSFLSVRISHDRSLLPAHKYTLELPKLEVLRVQMALGAHDRVDTPIHMICGNLKLLDLRYRLELDMVKLPKMSSTWMGPGELAKLEGIPATWMEFGGFVALEELQIDLAIHNVERLELVEKEQLVLLVMLVHQQLQMQRKQLYKLWEQQLEQQQLEQLKQQLEPQQLEQLRQQLKPPMQQPEEQPEELEEQLWEQGAKQLWEQGSEQLGEIEELMKLERYLMNIYWHWRKWLQLPKSLTHIQQSSLKFTLSTRVRQKAPRIIRLLVEDILVWRLPQLTNLKSSDDILPLFPNYLRKLRFHGFAMSHSFFSINLPSLVSLEIIADSPDHLLVMRYFKVPQLRVLRVQVEDGPGTLHKHDWGDTTSNRLDHISLKVEIPRGNHTLVFHLPQTQSLHVFSPYITLHLHLAKPVPLFYTLNAGLETMSGPSGGQGRTLSAMWNEELMTEWINQCGVPRPATLKTLISLQRIVLSQRSYVLSEQSPADALFKLLEQNIDTCPQLNSITLAQCPSSWPRFLYQLSKRNREAMLLGKTKCIEELGFYQPLHATIIRWLVDAINTRALDVRERPPVREGNAWPMRPFEAEGVFRSCYVCHITGMELGCLGYETRNVHCGRERGEGSKIWSQ